MLALYERTLGWVMDHRRTALGFSAGILVGTAVLFMVVPKGFIPTEDIGTVSGTTETIEGTSYNAMVQHQQAVADVLLHDPYLADFMSTVGGGTLNQRRVSLHLARRSQRPKASPVISDQPPKLA